MHFKWTTKYWTVPTNSNTGCRQQSYRACLYNETKNRNLPLLQSISSLVFLMVEIYFKTTQRNQSKWVSTRSQWFLIEILIESIRVRSLRARISASFRKVSRMIAGAGWTGQASPSLTIVREESFSYTATFHNLFSGKRENTYASRSE